MGFQHGKDTEVTVGGTDLSAFTSQSDYNPTADSHDVTTYGKDGHVFAPGLTNGTFTMSGTYANSTSTSPRLTLQPLIGAAVTTVVRKPEGTGSGKPQDSFSGLCTSYTESNPVAGMIAWTANFQISGDVTTSTQT